MGFVRTIVPVPPEIRGGVPNFHLGSAARFSFQLVASGGVDSKVRIDNVVLIDRVSLDAQQPLARRFVSVPANATALSFDLRRANTSLDDELVVLLGATRLGGHRLDATGTSRVRFAVPSNLRNTDQTRMALSRSVNLF